MSSVFNISGFKSGYINELNLPSEKYGLNRYLKKYLPSDTTVKFTEFGDHEENDYLTSLTIQNSEWTVTRWADWKDHMLCMGLPEEHKDKVEVNWEYSNYPAYKKWSDSVARDIREEDFERERLERLREEETKKRYKKDIFIGRIYLFIFGIIIWSIIIGALTLIGSLF